MEANAVNLSAWAAQNSAMPSFWILMISVARSRSTSPVWIDAQDGHVDALGVHVRHSRGERLSLERCAAWRFTGRLSRSVAFGTRQCAWMSTVRIRRPLITTGARLAGRAAWRLTPPPPRARTRRTRCRPRRPSRRLDDRASGYRLTVLAVAGSGLKSVRSIASAIAL
jgi:hypothetical protein